MKILVVGGSGFIGSYLMKEVEADNIDLKENKDVRDGIDKKYDAIIFLACYQGNSRDAFEANVQMYEALNNYNKNFSDTYLVYVSSAAVYTIDGWYALSKQVGEAYTKRFHNFTILRLSNVYGHGDGHGAPDRFMRGIKTINGTGDQLRDLIPVEKVVTTICMLVESKDTGKTINVSSGVGTSVNQMFKIFGKGRPKYIKDSETGIFNSVLTPGLVFDD